MIWPLIKRILFKHSIYTISTVGIFVIILIYFDHEFTESPTIKRLILYTSIKLDLQNSYEKIGYRPIVVNTVEEKNTALRVVHFTISPCGKRGMPAIKES